MLDFCAHTSHGAHVHTWTRPQILYPSSQFKPEICLVTLLDDLQIYLVTCAPESLLDPVTDSAPSDSPVNSPCLLCLLWIRITDLGRDFCTSLPACCQPLPVPDLDYDLDSAPICLAFTELSLWLTSSLLLIQPQPFQFQVCCTFLALAPFRCPSSPHLHHQGCLDGNCTRGHPHNLEFHFELADEKQKHCTLFIVM